MHEVAIVGALSSGKSTLLETFSGDPSVICVPDQARLLLDQGRDIDRRSLAFCMNVMDAYTRSTASARYRSGSATSLLTDGSVLNPIAYSLAFGAVDHARFLVDRAWPDITQIGRFLLMDIDGVPHINEDVRNETADDRRRVHESYLSVLDELRLPHVLISGPVEVRHQAASQYLVSDAIS